LRLSRLQREVQGEEMSEGIKEKHPAIDYGDLTTVSMCCTCPPSNDGSMCAGGNCACTDDYVCEKCTLYEKDGC
jgi:hypothetical protein